MAHAVLGPSSAHRWMVCTPSVKLSEGVGNRTSSYAEEGSLAHELCELKLKKKLYKLSTAEFNHSKKKIASSSLYTREMESYSDEYVDYVMEQICNCQAEPLVSIEERVDLSEYVPDGFGTADCIIIAENCIQVIDFKYGKGVKVEAEKNPQMLLYALGAYLAYEVIYDIKSIKMSIVQPRLNHISTWECTVDDLLNFADEVKVKAQLAIAGEGELVVGEHCRFCPVAASCRARADMNLDLAKYEFKLPPLLSNQEIGEILVQASDLQKWVAQLEDYALSECLKGHDVAGWKAVNGRSSRSFSDTDKAVKQLIDGGIAEELLWERKLLSLAQMEKIVGKKSFGELVGDLIESIPGKPTLVVESDKRPAISSEISAHEEFKNLKL